MKQCSACDRHLFGEEPSCPFCGAEQRTTSAAPSTSPVGSMLASATLALGLCLTACGPSTEVDSANASSSSDTGPSSTSTTLSTTTSTSTSTTAVTTDDGPAMTTIASTSSESDNGGDCPNVFYGGCPPDTGAVLECDLYTQDCRPGDKCVPWSYDGDGWDGTKCIPIANDPGAAGDVCLDMDGFDDCDLGLLCWAYNPETGETSCVPQCGGTERAPTCSEADQTCIVGTNELFQLCFDPCNPLLGDCLDGKGCYGTGDPTEFVCVWPHDPGAYGDPCLYVNDCDPGHQCRGGADFPSCGTLACCTPYCDVTLAEPCPEAELGVTCVPWFEAGMAPPGYEDVGLCILPPV